ncbi:hypothetical protein [Halobaculum sp. MBLA0143]|uniref:hypothetical protein n=1 Tax=Halobaculum sp. MBLA0143 TaxID=3079933 RepID=UPI0035250D3A
MTESPHYDYDTQECSVRERGRMYLDGIPGRAAVERGLEQTDFVENDGVWVKRRQRPDDDGLVVARAWVRDGRLRVEAEDVVGAVSLLPGTTLEVEPKVGWRPVVEMLLRVYGLDRTESYFGLPLSSVLDATVETDQIVALLAINYVDGVRTVRRQGLVRDTEFERRAGFESGGSVDVAATLRNRVSSTNATDGVGVGDRRPVWIDTNVRYDVSVNAAIHRAGRVLLELLRRGNADAHPELATLQSLVDREVRRLEDDGVRSSLRDVDTYSRLSVEGLPRQRRYYRRALRVSRSVLTGSLFGGGTDDLLVDYAFGTERLFQKYTHRVIETELDALRAADAVGVLDGLACESEPTLYPFAGETGFRHEPDHLLTDGDDAVAVLDSKYYATGKNPLADGDARSRLFAYAHLTGVEHTALLTPGYHAADYEFRDAPGGVEIVSPGGDESFSCVAYETAVREYLRRVLRDVFPVLRPLFAARDGVVALDSPDLSAILDLDSDFGEAPGRLWRRIEKRFTFGVSTPDPETLVDDGDRLDRRIGEVMNEVGETGGGRYPQDDTTCVPVFRSDVDDAGKQSLGENGLVGVLDLYLLTGFDGPADPDGRVDVASIEVY